MIWEKTNRVNKSSRTGFTAGCKLHDLSLRKYTLDISYFILYACNNIMLSFDVNIKY
jgi:hypothetical protein